MSEPFAPQTIRAGLAEPADARPYQSTGAQTDVVFNPYEPLPDENLDTEKMGLDMVRLLRQNAHHHPEVFPYLTKRLELPEYDPIGNLGPLRLRRLIGQLRYLRWMLTGESIVLRCLSMSPRFTSFTWSMRLYLKITCALPQVKIK